VSDRATPSIAGRLLGRLLVVFALAFAGSCALFLTLSWEQATVEIHGDAGELAERLAASIALGADGRATVMLDRDLAQDLARPGRGYAVVDLASGVALAGSTPSIVALLPAPPATTGRLIFAVPGTQGDPKASLSGHLLDRRIADRSFRVAVATQERHNWPFIAWAADELLDEVLPVGIPLFLATLAVAAITIRRTIQPVARLSVEAGAITPRTTGLRLDEARVPAEVLPLVRAFNAALVRLDEGFTLQRRFTANAAHQLRTPLAILRARLDGLAPRPEVALLKRDCDRIARVVSQLLSIARLESHQIDVGEIVELGALLAVIVADMAPLAIAEGRSLALDRPAEAIFVRGNSAALRDALANLIDNALRYGPPGHPVEIALRAGATISVADRGPGVAPADRARLFEPFWRGHDPRGSGSGLGLAIVHEIALAHGGRAEAMDRTGGGAEFRIAIPEASAPAAAPVHRASTSAAAQ